MAELISLTMASVAPPFGEKKESIVPANWNWSADAITTANMINVNASKTIVPQPTDVLLYILLYAAFFGLVNHPQPLGAFNPSSFLTIRFQEVLAAIRFLIDGILKPIFINLTQPRIGYLVITDI